MPPENLLPLLLTMEVGLVVLAGFWLSAAQSSRMLGLVAGLLYWRFTEFGAGVEDAVSNHTEMGNDITLHTKEVKDDEEEVLLHIQADGQARAQQIYIVPVPDSPRQSPSA
ncbi:hypothetical protein DUI87_14892 [Hirundo rustica rustica]|uniref:Uncharacterized protein n=1 Tax=Hirundo rustica rustica TaxID=333673 RepID=A0A3M0KBG6_HIRRU|nr:hypothetical protein DUI87_14892 [Hirundo rustica rustica]